MFSHLFISVTDFNAAMALYDPLMACLKLELRLLDPARPWAVWQSPGKTRPLFIVGVPYDGQAHDPGNGHMVAFTAGTHKTVQEAHAIAIGQGCKDEGAPGFRPHYHENYYGAYFRDHDGNKLCVVCHDPSA